MPATARPLSPHLSVYRWQIQMVTSIVHRGTGLFLAFGTLLIAVALIALAWNASLYASVRAFCASWLGLLLLAGWTWSLAFHFLNGIRHLLQDVGFGYPPAVFVRNSWIVMVGSFVLTAIVFALAWTGGAA